MSKQFKVGDVVEFERVPGNIQPRWDHGVDRGASGVWSVGTISVVTDGRFQVRYNREGSLAGTDGIGGYVWNFPSGSGYERRNGWPRLLTGPYLPPKVKELAALTPEERENILRYFCLFCFYQQDPETQCDCAL
jgi:hypothetical protein